MKVLLVEPDYVLASNYKNVLERSGHTVNHAPDAVAAITFVDKALPDVIILELLLPAHNGIEFLYEFRSYPEWQHTPIIILSFVRKDEINADVLFGQLGIVDYLYKPRTKLAQLAKAVSFIKI